jgi:hypothetical protein
MSPNFALISNATPCDYPLVKKLRSDSAAFSFGKNAQGVNHRLSQSHNLEGIASFSPGLSREAGSHDGIRGLRSFHNPEGPAAIDGSWAYQIRLFWRGFGNLR